MRKVIQFLREVRVEFGNISWPKKESLIQLTFVVISISLIISLILGAFDYIFTQSINFIGPNQNLPLNQTVVPEATIAPFNLATPAQTFPTINIQNQ